MVFKMTILDTIVNAVSLLMDLRIRIANSDLPEEEKKIRKQIIENLWDLHVDTLYGISLLMQNLRTNLKSKSISDEWSHDNIRSIFSFVEKADLTDIESIDKFNYNIFGLVRPENYEYDYDYEKMSHGALLFIGIILQRYRLNPNIDENINFIHKLYRFLGCMGDPQLPISSFNRNCNFRHHIVSYLLSYDVMAAKRSIFYEKGLNPYYVFIKTFINAFGSKTLDDILILDKLKDYLEIGKF